MSARIRQLIPAFRRRCGANHVIGAPGALLLAVVVSAGCSLNKESAELASPALSPLDLAARVPPDECGEPASADLSADANLNVVPAKAAASPRATPGGATVGCITRAQVPILETGSLDRQTTQRGATRGVAPASTTEELFVDFEPSSLSLPARERQALKEAVAVRLVGGGKAVRIFAARGGQGNWFDQAVVAQQRARAVNALLPPRMEVSMEFDPSLPEDTVRIEFIKREKSNG